MTINDVFNDIITSSQYGSLGLFIGSGFSKAVAKSDENSPFSADDWNQLLRNVCDNNHIEITNVETDYQSCPAIASSICNELEKLKSITHDEAVLKIKKTICELTSYHPSDNQIAKYSSNLKMLEPNWIITTNYDLLIESLMDNTEPISPSSVMVASKNKIPVYHMHGIRTEPSSIVINNDDYLLMNRPHNYRMDKLALLLTESTTLMFGYSINDTNVLTAFDWANNVYETKENSHKLIQIVYDESADDPVIEDENPKHILVKIHLISDFLDKFAQYKTEYETNTVPTSEEKVFISDIEKRDITKIEAFISDKEYRTKILSWYNKKGFNSHLIAFLYFLTDAFDKCSEEARQPGGFNGYVETTKLVVDILSLIDFKNLHPMLMNSIYDHFSSISGLIGHDVGEAWFAAKYWEENCNDIKKESIEEMYVRSKITNFSLRRLLLDTFPELKSL